MIFVLAQARTLVAGLPVVVLPAGLIPVMPPDAATSTEPIGDGNILSEPTKPTSPENAVALKEGGAILSAVSNRAEAADVSAMRIQGCVVEARPEAE